MRKNLILNALYVLMETRYGPTHWWPGDTPFEIAIGAILTQNTAWTNVERAIANLKRARLMSDKAILACPIEAIEAALTPSGYFRVKARRVRSFCAYLREGYGGSMKRLAKEPLQELREELLAINGIGPETADDILLYACGKPVFVVDAYTRRILGRHGLIDRSMEYEKLRGLLEENQKRDVHRYSEYHALLVYVGKDYCRRVPRCAECPLGPALKKGKPLAP